mmetsp:Transcript_51830/g.143539  ORF Transcript_51830/g.143539 Transcript_51830/m.143539 type:complete len:293 (+) Transcript_51830:135-1013(+)
MLGRKPAKELRAAAAPRDSARGAAAKKRKWQEDSEDSGSEGGITKADLEAWRKTIAEEERQEQLERERQESEARERAEAERERKEAEQRRKEEEEARALREAEEARKAAEAAEAERQRQEAATSFVGAGPLPMDSPAVVSAGVRPGKEHLYKTSYCKRWEQGNCQFGAACHFAHGERELRGRPPKGSAPGTLSVALPEALPKAAPMPLPIRVAGVPGQPVELPPPAALLQCLPPPPPPPAAMSLQAPASASAALSMLSSLLASARASAAAAAAPGADAGAPGAFGAAPPRPD